LTDYLSFKLDTAFVNEYRSKEVPWGFVDAAGSPVSEIVFFRTYSRKKPDGSKETWQDVCERVINGMFSLQKDHVLLNHLPWDEAKAQRSAQEAFDRMFNFKWTPPGRGLWMMGTELVNKHRNSAALQNCAFLSTGDLDPNDPGEAFGWLMEASMLGVGVGFDTKASNLGLEIHEPRWTGDYRIPDTREGWVESTRLLINAFLVPGAELPYFDYSIIRPAGAPIATFGGTAAGPEPLIKLHTKLEALFRANMGKKVDSLMVMDIANLIGVCVVSGNVRRSAELAMGSLHDENFLTAKDFEAHPYRAEWSWMSNNSVEAYVGDDLSHIVDNIALNGEPGVIWMDVTRDYGRLIDPPDFKDHRAAGYNPCAEQSLESREMCTLVETYLNRHDSLEDFQRTLKFAYLYAKTVTLLPTHWEKTNAIVQRNRRIGTSVSGIANFVDNNGRPKLREWLDKGYRTVQDYDNIYSEWLCVRESIKTTTVKPSGTVSLLAGESPGVHWAPGGEYHLRGVVFQKDDPMVALFRDAGYEIQTSAYTPETSVFVQFPIHSRAKRAEKQATIFEKIDLAALVQRYWSDNSVSVTVSFDKETEAQHVPTVLQMYEGQLKTVSFLPQGNETYKQMPYQEIDEDQYEDLRDNLLKVDMSSVYLSPEALEAQGERGCTTDACEIPKN
jgi:ribonucleoside-triphosphate reductase